MSAFGWIDSMLPEVVDAAARGAIVLTVALVITTLLHRRSAAARHAVWVGAIAVQLVVLALTVWGPERFGEGIAQHRAGTMSAHNVRALPDAERGGRFVARSPLSRS